MELCVKGGQPEQSKHLAVNRKISVCLPFFQNLYGTEDIYQTITVMKFIHFSIISSIKINLSLI